MNQQNKETLIALVGRIAFTNRSLGQAECLHANMIKDNNERVLQLRKEKLSLEWKIEDLISRL